MSATVTDRTGMVTADLQPSEDRFVVDFLIELVSAPVAETSAAINRGLDRIAGVVAASHAAVFRFVKGEVPRLVQDWAAAAAQPAGAGGLTTWPPHSGADVETLRHQPPEKFCVLSSFDADSMAGRVVGARFGTDHDGAVLLLGFAANAAAGQAAVFARTGLKPVFDGLLAMVRRLDKATADPEGMAAAENATDRYKAVLDSLPDIVAEIDHDGYFRHIHAKDESQLVTPADRMIGRKMEQVLPPAVAAQRRAMMRDLDISGQTESRTYQLDSPSGHRWYNVSAARIGAEGQPRYLFLSREVSREVEQRQAFERLSEIARLTSNLVVITDADQRVEWVNAAFTRLSGYTLDDIRTKRIGPYLRHSDTDPATEARIRAALAAGEKIQAEILNQSKQGVPYWLRLHIEPLRNDAGDLTGFMAVQTDITEQKRLIADLEARTQDADAARNQLLVAIDSLEEGFVLYDANDQFVICNRRYREIYTGSDAVLVAGTPFRDIARHGAALGLFPDAKGKLDDWVASRSDKRRASGTSFEHSLADGRVLQVVERLTPVGERIEVHADITELKRAEQRLLHVIEGAQVSSWEWDIKADLQAVNNRWAEIMGYRLEDLGTVTYDIWRSLVHPDDLAQTEAMINQCLHGTADIFEAVYRQQHRDGHWIWFLDRGRVIRRAADGSPAFMAGVQIDISDQKARESALLDAKNELESALADRANVEQRLVDIATVSDGWLWEQDSDLRFSLVLDGVYFNDGGVPKEGMLGKTHEEWLAAHPDMLSGGDWDSLLATVHAHQPFRDFIYRAPKSTDGVVRWRRINGTPIFDSSGSFAGYRGVGADITELYLEKARAEDASHTKSMFLANMSHEIRTPLNGVLGMAEVLDGALVNADHKRMIATIRRSGESLLNILNDILDMSKIEAGKLQLECVPFSLGDLAERVEELHSLRAEEKGLAFEVLLGSGAEIPRAGDPHRVQQILHNLVSNAIKFTERGEVSVKISGRAGKPLVIEVSDTGIGMTPGQVERLHDEFSQADVSVTRRFGGTGLGMAITRTLTEMMDGTITVASVPNVGTTIQITLPLPVSTVVAPAAPEHSQGPISLAGVRVLAADDNATNRAVLELMLQRRGAEVVLVNDGAQAISAWAAGGFDVVLLDISMPVMDGPTALTGIRSLEAQTGASAVPIIAVTANAMAHQVADYLVLGFDSCVAKPINSNDLARAIITLVTEARKS